MPREFVERQLRLMPLGEVEAGAEPSGAPDVESLADDRWDGVMREITRMFVRRHFVGRVVPASESHATQR